MAIEYDPATINCREACINGCVLGDRCPNLEHLATARKFVSETSIERMLQIAAERFLPREERSQPPD
ncbi:MAG: hypothetical protein HC919_09705 [Oscillatoriales cyanobacterium SM2_2_1]|nr:hypothetical protein [Oscillatoriales cyanobacterium SM2_2_1]